MKKKFIVLSIIIVVISIILIICFNERKDKSNTISNEVIENSSIKLQLSSNNDFTFFPTTPAEGSSMHYKYKSDISVCINLDKYGEAKSFSITGSSLINPNFDKQNALNCLYDMLNENIFPLTEKNKEYIISHATDDDFLQRIENVTISIFNTDNGISIEIFSRYF